MKFSQRKKDKMRRNRQRRISKNCNNMIGCCIDFKTSCEVVDQAKIKGIMYLLTEDDNSQYAIYKIVTVGKYVKLADKKVLLNEKAFSNSTYWKKHTIIEINAYGKIEHIMNMPQVSEPIIIIVAD